MMLILGVIARATAGLSGAELANLLNESALHAARRDKESVDGEDIEEAREKILYGRERRRAMDDDEKKDDRIPRGGSRFDRSFAQR